MNEPPVAAFPQADGGKKAGKRGLFGRPGDAVIFVICRTAIMTVSQAEAPLRRGPPEDKHSSWVPAIHLFFPWTPASRQQPIDPLLY